MASCDEPPCNSAESFVESAHPQHCRHTQGSQPTATSLEPNSNSIPGAEPPMFQDGLGDPGEIPQEAPG